VEKDKSYQAKCSVCAVFCAWHWHVSHLHPLPPIH
jgi:hypothetical protein